jgi:hypothetical protein
MNKKHQEVIKIMATMRNPPPSNINTWIGHKEQGKNQFQNEEYEQALASYRAALNPEYACPSVERQILFSVRGVILALLLCTNNNAHSQLFLCTLYRMSWLVDLRLEDRPWLGQPWKMLSR